MELLLAGAALALAGMVVAWLAFTAANPVSEGAAVPRQLVHAPARFFAGRARARVPLEMLLLQIESHVRLEQAAAESFLESPDPALLHTPTLSPLIEDAAC